MTHSSALLADVEAFMANAGIAPTKFGLRAVNDGKFVYRLRRGARLWPETETRVRHYMQTQETTPPAFPRRKNRPTPQEGG